METTAAKKDCSLRLCILCAVLLIVTCELAGCKKGTGQSGVPVVTATIVWGNTQQSQSAFPIIRSQVMYDLLGATGKKRSVGTLATHKVINGREYFGVRVVPTDTRENTVLSEAPCLFEIFVRPATEEGSHLLDIRLATQVNCRVVMSEFEARVFEEVDGETIELVEPFTFAPGRHDLQAIEYPVAR